MKKKFYRAFGRILPMLLVLIGGVLLALDGTGDKSLRESEIKEMNEITGIGWQFVGYIQMAIVVIVILVFVINVAMEAGKERPDLAGILQKLLWAGGIGGTAFMVVELIVAIYGAQVNPAMIVAGG
jgi:hypothetical protein